MTTPTMQDWIRFHGTFDSDPNKKVSKVEFQIEANDAVSSTNGVDRVPLYFTDVQFQAGSQLSGWIPKTEEMLDRLKWTHDESVNTASPNGWNTVEDPNPTGSVEPQVFEGVEKRWFNILGRGHNTAIVPNYYPEDWDVPILPTGIDLTLFPKEDFDLLRISTSSGVMLPENEQWYKQDGGIYQEIKAKYEDVIDSEPTTNEGVERRDREISNFENIMQPLFEGHPIHQRFTREFWVDGATAGTEINVHANTRTATLGGEEIKIVGESAMDINGTDFPIDRKKFLLAPKGTATIRIEFYKQVERTITTFDKDENGNYFKVKKTFQYMKDGGIGYHGTAGFHQWTYGRSRI